MIRIISVRGARNMTNPVLVISYGEQLHKCSLHPTEAQAITIGNSLLHHVTFLTLESEITVHWNGKVCEVNEQQIQMNDQTTIMIGATQLTLYMTNHSKDVMQTLDVTEQLNITFGKEMFNHVTVTNTNVDFMLTREVLTEDFTLLVNEGTIYHNHAQVMNHIKIAEGDQLFFDGVFVLVGNGDITMVLPPERLVSKLINHYLQDDVYQGYYPDYHRSPRIIYREPEEKKVIAKPSNKPSKPSEQLMRTIIPPIVMIAALAVVSIFQPRGIYIIVMLAMTVTTIILSVTSYVKSSKQYRIDMKERTRSYREYLQNKTKELFDTSLEQQHALKYHYPSVEEIKEMTMEVNARIYEKTMFHHDFLMYRVGMGNIEPSFEIEFREEEFTQDEDELVKEAKALHTQFQQMQQVPITTSLMNGPVGYIGQRSLVLEQLQLLVMQTAFFHSYHELQFVVIFPEEEKQQWKWMRWLPHASLKELNVRGFVYHDRSRDQVLTSLYQILKERKMFNEEKNDKHERTYFTPHYTVLITDEKIILDHTIMEFFNEDPSDLGVTLIFVQDVLQSLPEHVATVIDIRDASSGNVILEEGELINQAFVPDHFPVAFNKEAVSRSLAPLNHLQSLKSTIPEAVTFLEMYGVETVEAFNLRQNWQQNETYKSLAVPLGLRGKDDLVHLNLHEKAHGPHGLVAGTTGSGKSEIIQSYILSLAVNFHPHEVAFLLIDYKGGGMANLFKHLPHLLGTITNLDKAQSLRALASIKAELQKRQRLFGECDVNHINQYQKLYKEGKVEEPMPHLFLISDEFAELKAEQPDFMKELVSTARDRKSTRLNSSHVAISYAVFCL